jgi:hypothetical protein
MGMVQRLSRPSPQDRLVEIATDKGGGREGPTSDTGIAEKLTGEWRRPQHNSNVGFRKLLFSFNACTHLMPAQ